MKPLLVIFLTVCFAFFANAQDITLKQLQGTWRLSAYEEPDFSLNYDTEEYVTVADIQSRYTPEELQVFLEDLVRMLQADKDTYLVFNDGTVTIKSSDTIKDKHEVRLQKDDYGQTICSFIYSQGWNEPAISEDYIVYVLKDKLYMIQPDGQVKRVYIKEP
ncbi:MAG: hypothetical protein V4581_13365 [Bacteroidota bacterium]